MSESRPAVPVGVPQPLVEALLVDRERMIRVFRIALKELHDRRLLTPRCTGAEDIVELIRYWDTVFGWIKDLGGEELVMMSRRSVRP
jgi:hypothetical protein